MLAEKIELFCERLSDALWGAPMVAVLIVGGLILSCSSGFVQFKYFFLAVRTAVGGMFKRAENKKGSVSPFEAVCTALAGTIGTGNITGVIIALCLGGPGAVFWMWVSALIGMGTKYAEIVLAVKYRERCADGYAGGPMYYIKNGLGRGCGWLAAAFCMFGAVAAFGIGNMMQMGSIMSAVEDAAQALFPAAVKGKGLRLIVGALMALLCGLTVAGGAQRRGKVASYLVPVMALFYIAGALCVIGVNINKLPQAFADIIRGAFTGRAAAGGAAGGSVKLAMSWGFKRGMFSNEAGLGSSPIAHASADTDSPVKQAFLGIFEVFADTIVMCTLTALMVMVSGVPVDFGTVGGAEYCTMALAGVFGRTAASVFVPMSMLLFAFSSIVGWSLYGERCAEYLLGSGAVPVYRMAFVLVTFLSSFMSFTFIIRLSDVMNALMILPNMTALILLSPVVKKETVAWFEKRRRQLR
ncbi:MAG: alanine/glycine:cation symporter family protein [Oscillospiraceae bacterium]